MGKETAGSIRIENIIKRLGGWDTLLILGIYLLGVGLTAWYVFGTSYLTVSDTAREYYLFLEMRTKGYWELHREVTGNAPEYALQMACLFTTYIPAKISSILPVTPELFFKIYHILFVPVLPVAVYVLARRFVMSKYAVIAALFPMAWVCFLQGASMARTNIALIFIALGLLVLFSDIKKGIKYTGLVVAGTLAPLAHYGASMIAVAVIAGTLVVIGMLRLRGRVETNHVKPLIVFGVSLALITAVWCFGVSGSLMREWLWVKDVSNTIAGTQAAAGTGIQNIWTPDKIIQAAFGVNAPDGVSIKYSYLLLAVAWGTVMVMAYGIFKCLRRRETPLALRLMGVFSFLACISVVAFPPLSRAYGIERVYYQAMLILSVYFAIGIRDITRKLHIPYYALGIPLITVYGVLMKLYGVISSITG